MIVPPLVYFVASVVLWQLANAMFMPELLANRLFEVLPASFIERGVQLLGPLAKQLAFIIISILYFGAYFLFSLSWVRLRRVFGNVWFASATLWLVNELILFPLAGKGAFGMAMPQGAFSASVFLFVSHWIFARMLQMQAPKAQPLSPGTRRVFLVGAGIAVLVAVKKVWDVWFRPAGRIEKGSGVFPDLNGLAKEITPTEEFYTVSKNSVDPVVPLADWTLKVDGLVDRPMTFTVADLQKMSILSMYATLSCISNEVGGDWTGNARWTGVPLAQLLKVAGTQKEVSEVVFHAADGYIDTIPVVRAVHPFCLLAYEMNGEPLTSTHGFPLRLIVPGIYGMKNVKWITRIELLSEDVRGFWQKRGWDDDAPYKLMSRIDVARDGQVAGIAFGGDRGVGSVQVKIGDAEWREAKLREPLSPLSWVLWHLEADVKGKRVLVRMTDSNGQMQIGQPAPPFPEGSSGYHSVVGS
jgi:DMSO/TMAO reductase YedYZ molybdopterin-dependent catalytic subunit